MLDVDRVPLLRAVVVRRLDHGRICREAEIGDDDFGTGVLRLDGLHSLIQRPRLVEPHPEVPIEVLPRHLAELVEKVLRIRVLEGPVLRVLPERLEEHLVTEHPLELLQHHRRLHIGHAAVCAAALTVEIAVPHHRGVEISQGHPAREPTRHRAPTVVRPASTREEARESLVLPCPRLFVRTDEHGKPHVDQLVRDDSVPQTTADGHHRELHTTADDPLTAGHVRPLIRVHVLGHVLDRVARDLRRPTVPATARLVDRVDHALAVLALTVLVLDHRVGCVPDVLIRRTDGDVTHVL